MQTRSQRDGVMVYGQVQSLFEVFRQQVKDAENGRIKAKADDIRTTAQAYGNLCQRLPMHILRQGLVQTVAFLKAKSGGDSKDHSGEEVPFSEHARLLEQLQDSIPMPTDQDSVSYISQADLCSYRRLTQRALEVCEWYRRFSASEYTALMAEATSDTTGRDGQEKAP